MKSIPYYLFISLLALACTTPIYYQQAVNDLPSVPTTYRAGVFFKGDDIPREPYFEVIEYNNVVKGRWDEEKIRNFLQKEGRLEGVDLFIDVEYSYSTNQETTWLTLLADLIDYENTEPYRQTVFYTGIRGRGVVFLRHLDFIGSLPEYEYFYLIDEKTDLPRPFFNIEYKLTGQIFKVYPSSQEAMEFFHKYFKYYTDYHLVKQRERWLYKRDKSGKTTKRHWQRTNGRTLRRCYFDYNDEGKLERIRIVNNHLKTAEFVRYSYYEQGRLATRLVEMYTGAKVREEYEYNGNLLRGRRITIFRPDDKPLNLSTTILYYDPDYLNNYYYEQYAAKRSD